MKSPGQIEFLSCPIKMYVCVCARVFLYLCEREFDVMPYVYLHTAHMHMVAFRVLLDIFFASTEDETYRERELRMVWLLHIISIHTHALIFSVLMLLFVLVPLLPPFQSPFCPFRFRLFFRRENEITTPMQYR